MLASSNVPTVPVAYKPLRAKLIFNPIAGDPAESPFQLAELVTLLQYWNILPEVHMITPESHVTAEVQSALKRGIRMIIVAGGDGTVEASIGPMVGSQATLGIIPTGTRNNLAISLGIPMTLPEAVSLLRQGNRLRIDTGRAQCGRKSNWFLETSSLGLVSALYPSADDIQHGNLARVADFFSTLVASQPVSMRLTLDRNQQVETEGHLALVANMPYFGPNFRISPDVLFDDGLLDVFVFSNLTKLELVSYAVQVTTGTPTDERVLHFRVKEALVEPDPAVPVMADGFDMGEGPLQVSVNSRSLNVMAGPIPPLPPNVQAGTA